MAKIIEEFVVLKISKLVRDDAELNNETFISAETRESLQETINIMMTEVQPASVVEIIRIEDME